jgi:hypothetical protein
MSDNELVPETAKTKTAETKMEMTPEEFITKAPLFVKIPIGFYPPKQISFDCLNEKCKKETTWVRVDEPIVLGSGSENRVSPAD